jgi:hypothetical protein
MGTHRRPFSLPAPPPRPSTPIKGSQDPSQDSTAPICATKSPLSYSGHLAMGTSSANSSSHHRQLPSAILPPNTAHGEDHHNHLSLLEPLRWAPMDGIAHELVLRWANAAMASPIHGGPKAPTVHEFIHRVHRLFIYRNNSKIQENPRFLQIGPSNSKKSTLNPSPL